MKWVVDSKAKQLGGKGTDYGAWIVGRREDGSFPSQHINVQIGQCGDEPDGDARAGAVVEAMVAGLNTNLGAKP